MDFYGTFPRTLVAGAVKSTGRRGMFLKEFRQIHRRRPDSREWMGSSSRFLTCWQTIAIKISRIRQISG